MFAVVELSDNISVIVQVLILVQDMIEVGLTNREFSATFVSELQACIDLMLGVGLMLMVEELGKE